jgi:hypothetical protein
MEIHSASRKDHRHGYADKAISRPPLGRLSAVQVDTRVGLRRHGGRHDDHRFSWGGWITGGTSQAQAKATSEMARSEPGRGHLHRKVQRSSGQATQLIALKALADN